MPDNSQIPIDEIIIEYDDYDNENKTSYINGKITTSNATNLNDDCSSNSLGVNNLSFNLPINSGKKTGKKLKRIHNINRIEAIFYAFFCSYLMTLLYIPIHIKKSPIFY